MNFVSITLLTLFFSTTAHGEKFSALSEMEILARDEAKIIKEFEEFLSEMQNVMEHLKLKLESWKLENEYLNQDAEKYIAHPINAYLLIKRLTVDIDELLIGEILKPIDEFKTATDSLRPNYEDLVGATEGLLRLQKMYKLKTKDFANGIVDGYEGHRKLSSHDLFTIAKTAFQIDNEDYYVKEYIERAFRANDFSDDLELLNFMLKVKKNVKPMADDYVRNGRYNVEKETILYSKLCRKLNLKSTKEISSLKCFYDSKNFYTKIGPFKVEQVDNRISLVIFHDVIYDNEIEELKKISLPKFKRGTVVRGNSTKTKSKVRTAQVAWFEDKSNKVVRKISKRVEDMTGLSTSTAEHLQTQVYGIAGHYNPHWDHQLKSEFVLNGEQSNRIATVLFYLSTVERGGATVFPYVRVHVPAVKGTAAFWYNLHHSGESEFYTRHAACPVLVGSKWVANKWIHNVGNEFKRPCLPGNFKEHTELECFADVY